MSVLTSGALVSFVQADNPKRSTNEDTARNSFANIDSSFKWGSFACRRAVYDLAYRQTGSMEHFSTAKGSRSHSITCDSQIRDALEFRKSLVSKSFLKKSFLFGPGRTNERTSGHGAISGKLVPRE